MARYIGPKSKIARKFGEPIYGPDKAFEHKNFPPGMHGNSKRRKKVSEYGTQLKEKQKAKYMYGVLERQFRNLFEKAHSHKGITGTVLCNFWKAVWIMWFSVWELLRAVPLPVSWYLTNTLPSMVKWSISLPTLSVRVKLSPFERNLNHWLQSVIHSLHVVTVVFPGWNGMVRQNQANF